MPLSFGGIVVVAIAAYFLPFIVSCCRSLPNKFGIFFLNLIFGFTIIGWGALLFYCLLSNNSGRGNFV
ncbi:superinfection immunity protein [Rhizobium jaguaris]|uniref:Superinfection immunity protein n=1 Tax=Rhizobium jaguaris TaxID=1312183 RepID=A0A387FRR9_9HYPH|nr:superinfection immunity protein [Rhizobium jaguaris]